MSPHEKKVQKMQELGMQEKANCSSAFMSELEEFGIKDMRARADKVTQADFKNMLIVWFFQASICFFVVLSTEIPLDEVYSQQLQVEFGITRIITMVIMHIIMQSEFQQSLDMMKYALNHPWKFRNYKLAFVTGIA